MSNIARLGLAAAAIAVVAIAGYAVLPRNASVGVPTPTASPSPTPSTITTSGLDKGVAAGTYRVGDPFVQPFAITRPLDLVPEGARSRRRRVRQATPDRRRVLAGLDRDRPGRERLRRSLPRRGTDLTARPVHGGRARRRADPPGGHPRRTGHRCRHRRSRRQDVRPDELDRWRGRRLQRRRRCSASGRSRAPRERARPPRRAVPPITSG